MRRLAGLIAVGVIGTLAFVLIRRARSAGDHVSPAAPTAPVHMAVGDSAPEVEVRVSS